MDAVQYSKKWFALFGLSFLAFTGFLDFTIVNTALPDIQRELHASVVQLQWIINIFALVVSVLLILSGVLGDRFGRRKVFYIGSIIFAIAAFGAGASTNAITLTIFRALQGVGTAVFLTVSPGLISQAFPEKEHVKAIGVYSAITGMGLAIGPFVGGVLVALLSWRWVFFINIPIIAVGLLLCLCSLRKSAVPKNPPRIDWPGFFLLLIGLGSLIYGVIHGQQQGWTLPATLFSLFVALIALPALAIVEIKTKHPLLDFSIFKNKMLILVTLMCVTAGVNSYVLMFFNPLYLSIVRDLPPFLIGTALVAIPAMQVIVSLLIVYLVKRMGLANVCLLAIIAGLITTCMHAFFGLNTAFWFIILAYIILGINWGLGNAATIIGVNQEVDEHKISGTVGTVFTLWDGSGTIFLALTVALFSMTEMIFTNASLAAQQIHLTEKQQHLVKVMLSDPGQAKTLLTQFTAEKAHQLYAIFEQAFVYGFHAMAWLSSAVMLLTCIAGFLLVFRIRRQKVQ